MATWGAEKSLVLQIGSVGLSLQNAEGIDVRERSEYVNRHLCLSEALINLVDSKILLHVEISSLGKDSDYC